ncbi:MAG: hypothetical protein ACJAT5_000629 [Lentimonas sp.]|jgi:hypothetical protein
MVPKSLLLCLIAFWGLFLCTNIFVYAGWFGSWIAYPIFFSLVFVLFASWCCLFHQVYNSIRNSRCFFLHVALLSTLTALSVIAYSKWCLNPSENIFGAFDSGMYFATASHISTQDNQIMQANWPTQAPESLKEWWLGQNSSEAQRRSSPGPKYWNFIVGYFFLDQDARSGPIATPFPNGYPTLLASALTVSGPLLAFCLNTIIHLTTSALLGLLAIQYLKQTRAASAALLMLFFPLSVWSANHLYAEALLILAWFSSILAWSYRDKMPIIAGMLTGAGLGLGLLIKIDALLGALLLALLFFEFKKRTRFTLSALVSFLLCAGWAAYSNTSFTKNYAKDTIQALWETSPIAQYPEVAAVVSSFLLLVAFVVIRLKFTRKRLTINQAKRPLTNYRNAALTLLPWVLMTIFAYLYFIRPNPVCPDTFLFTGSGQVIRSYREETFFRLSWFFSPIVLWVGLLGTSLLVGRIKESWQVAFYCCGLFSLLFFSYDIRCNPYQPYCMRRLATYANPLLLLGIVSGLTSLFELKKIKPVSFLLTPLLIFVAAMFFTKGIRIHQVSEMEGLFDELSVLAQELPDDGVLLIPKRSKLSNFSAPLRFVFEKEIFNVNPDKRSKAYVDAMQSYLFTSTTPVYLLTTSPVDFLGLPIADDSEQITDGFLKIKYSPRSYDTPYYKEKEVKIHYYLFKLSARASRQETI